MTGKFIQVGDDRLWVAGATYGTFAPDADGDQFGTPEAVDGDFRAMAASGVNAVRTYTVPPAWLLDAALRHGLWVMVGLPWEQHVAFLEDRGRAAAIEDRVREGVRACAGHPALLCFAIGNEIPAPVVRWHGRGPVERFLERLYRAAKDEDPGALVTYVNFPSTEYLELPFADFVCFNVYLEERDRLAVYLARLQNLAGERPLVMAEIGLDSARNGREEQARSLEWQVTTAFESGCAGTFVFAWTDEWHRGGEPIEDWDFGLTDRSRRPKPALHAVERAYSDLPFPVDMTWPSISVVVCSHNGEATLDECLAGVGALSYPRFETIVVDDGSSDRTGEIAAAHGARVIRTENRGLSAARTTGAVEATGEIVAYLDDDAWPDPDWLKYVALALETTDHAGVGGPNLPVPGDGLIAGAVANAPGGPVHVLLSDTVAEHIPGCNMAYRRDRLLAIGGFDAQFRVAGDDVDVCWQLQERGWTLGFHAAAMVWHHRRGSVRAFWRQQRGYGRAEALLERKWPEKYNAPGHLTWAGRLYGRGATSLGRSRVYYGIWGTGAFQPGLERPQPQLAALAAAPEWYLVVAGLAAIVALGALAPPLLLALPLLVAAAALLVVQAVRGAIAADTGEGSPPRRLGMGTLTTLLVLMQPAARLTGRLARGLSPWRRARLAGFGAPRRRTEAVWFERWRSFPDRLTTLEAALRSTGARVRRGGAFDRWELDARAGRLAMALAATGLAASALAGSWMTALVMGSLLVLLALGAVAECGRATAAALTALHVPEPVEAAAETEAVPDPVPPGAPRERTPPVRAPEPQESAA